MKQDRRVKNAWVFDVILYDLRFLISAGVPSTTYVNSSLALCLKLVFNIPKKHRMISLFRYEERL